MEHSLSPARPPLIAAVDIPAALGFMTRLPVRVNGRAAMARGAAAAWAWPLAGALVGALAGAVLLLAGAIGLPPLAGGLLAVGAQIVLTGALHEDGLADSADGLWGGWEPARRLEIMRDSRIGSYGVLALVLAVGIRSAACAALAAGPLALAALCVAGAMSRAAMAMVMGLVPPARRDGLSVGAGRPRRATVALGLALAVGLALVLLPFASALLALALALAASGLVAAIAQARIGGQTGDILGASQQMAEIAVLLGLSALLAA